MGIRIVVGEQEPIGKAIRRLKKKTEQCQLPWDLRRRVEPADRTQERRKKKYKKRLKARLATLADQINGIQPVSSLDEAREKLRKRTGKP